jgi:hypothetical protein
MGLEKEKESTKEQVKQRRRENALKRAQLGFKDKANAADEGVEDQVLEDLEFNSKQYLQQIEEQKERKPVRLVTPIKGISKEEIESLKLTEQEKFRPI